MSGRLLAVVWVVCVGLVAVPGAPGNAVEPVMAGVGTEAVRGVTGAGECIERLVWGGHGASWGGEIRHAMRVPTDQCFVSLFLSSDAVGFLSKDGNAQLWGCRRVYDHPCTPKWQGLDAEPRLQVPVLPPGVRFVNVVRANEILLYVRSDGVVAAQGDEELVLYTPPDGVSYVVGGATQMGESTVGVLARSDGVLDVVWLYGELRGQIATQIDLGLPSGVVPVKVARGGSRSAVLDSAGEVHFFVVDGSLSEVDRVLRRVPRLPDGVRFTDVYLSGSASLFARSDGAVVSLGDAPRSVVWAGSGAVTRFAKGVKPLKFLRGGVLLLSDGNLQAMLYKDVMNENKEELGGDWVAKLGKGWAFVDGVSWRSTPAYGAARLSGRAVSSVGQVVVPSGDQGRVRVDVVSRGGLKGGKVVVRLGDAVVGKATVTSSSRVWVTLDRGKLSVSKQNRLTAQFMGNANAAKSAKVAFRLPPIRPGSK